MIFHLTQRAVWKEAQATGSYRPDSLETEGFIHCSTSEQILAVANAFYRAQANLVVLWIDPDRLDSRLRWESPDPLDPFAANKFPHIYGPLNQDAVVKVTGLERDPDGVFRKLKME